MVLYYIELHIVRSCIQMLLITMENNFSRKY